MIKLFQNLKMSVKLVSVVIFAAIFIGVVGIIGINNMNKINSNTSILYNYNLRTIQESTNLRQNYLRLEQI